MDRPSSSVLVAVVLRNKGTFSSKWVPSLRFCGPDSRVIGYQATVIQDSCLQRWSSAPSPFRHKCTINQPEFQEDDRCVNRCGQMEGMWMWKRSLPLPPQQPFSSCICLWISDFLDKPAGFIRLATSTLLVAPVLGNQKQWHSYGVQGVQLHWATGFSGPQAEPDTSG